MSRFFNAFQSRLAVVAAGLCLASAPLYADATGTTRSHHRSHGSKKASSSAHHRKKGRAKSHGRPSSSSLKNRLAHLRPQPQRVEQIQRALISAGDLHEQPTGEWDAQTREAMARYQSENGFPPTGLPDSKSLMKMGLGPHPLPESLNRPPTPGDAGLSRKPEAAASSPADVPADQSTPPQQP